MVQRGVRLRDCRMDNSVVEGKVLPWKPLFRCWECDEKQKGRERRHHYGAYMQKIHLPFCGLHMISIYNFHYCKPFDRTHPPVSHKWTLDLSVCLSEQVLDWIENHGEAFLSKHTGVGKSLHRARALQKRHEDFEEVAQVCCSRLRSNLPILPFPSAFLWTGFSCILPRIITCHAKLISRYLYQLMWCIFILTSI